MGIAFLFPGQGGQSTGFLSQLPQHGAVQSTLAEAAAVLDRDPLTLDSAAALTSTVAVQLSLLIAGVATTRALAACGVRPDMVAGHSVGAFAAAVACGALDFRDALALIVTRANSMEHAYPQGFGLAVIVGLTESQVRQIISECGGANAQIYLAAINAPRQLVLAGSRTTLGLAMTSAKLSGASKAALLAVAVPSHCDLMRDVSERIRLQIASIKFSDANVKYICNCTARATMRALDIREDLVLGVVRPVLWHDSTTVMGELGARLFVEFPAGTALTDLVRAAYPGLRAVAMSSSTIDSVVRLAQTREYEN